jgi:peptide/nickel transport system ATP-binding protein
VDGIDFDVDSAEILGLVGESGSGKTTVGRLIAKLEEPTAGSITLDGTDIVGLRGSQLKEYRRDVQMVFQNPYESIDPRFAVRDWVGGPLGNLGRSGKAGKEDQILEILDAVGLRPAADYLDRLPHELSGGQRQRVDIARAMVVSPRLLIADEAVSMLDASVRSGILRLLLRLRQEQGIAALFISHDLAVARYVSDRIAVMYLGKIVEIGPTDNIVRQPAHPYTKMLIAAVPEPDPELQRKRIRRAGEPGRTGGIPSGCRFRTRCPLSETVCVEQEPPLLQLEDGRLVACHFADTVLAMDELPTEPS